MTAKERLRRAVDELTEREASLARIVVEREPGHNGGTDLAELPDGWDRMVGGEQMPDVVAALDRSRAGR